MTYRELIYRLSEISEEQKDQPVFVCSPETPPVAVGGLWILEENYVNPTGEGIEPESMYPVSEFSEDDIVFRAGTVFLDGGE